MACATCTVCNPLPPYQTVTTPPRTAGAVDEAVSAALVAMDSQLSLGSGSLASGTVAEPMVTQLHPVWLSLSAPAAPARQLGIALALETLPPSTAGGGSGVRGGSAAAPARPPDGPRGPPSSTGGYGGGMPPPGTPAAAVETASSGMSGVAARLHRNLQLLEQRAWDCLRCDEPEQVLNTLLSEEFRPILESVVNISQDDRGIWKGSMSFTPTAADASHPATPGLAATAVARGGCGGGGSGGDGGIVATQVIVANQSEASMSAPGSAAGSRVCHSAPVGIADDDDDNASFTSTIATADQPEESGRNATSSNRGSSGGSGGSGGGSGGNGSVGTIETNEGIGDKAEAADAASLTSVERRRASHPYGAEVLPFALQLLPCHPGRGPNGLFRLFFYWEELVAVTALSPWTFYPEVGGGCTDVYTPCDM